MAIEFRCPNCDKKLKTGDDKAGKTAKCPQCGTPVTVPAASAAPEDEFGDFGDFPPLEDPAAGAPPARRARAAGGAQVACPMCGAMNDPAASRCYACGEDLFAAADQAAGTGRPANFDVGDQLSRGYDLFKADMGTCIAATIIYLLIPGAINFVVGMVIGVVAAAAAGNNPVMSQVIQQTSQIPSFVIQVFFDAGYTLFLLNVIRRRPAAVGDVFAGGRFYLSMLINRFLFTLMVLLPFLPAAIPFFILAANNPPDPTPYLIAALGLGTIGTAVSAVLGCIFWPHCWVIVDRNLGGIDPLKASAHLTSGNRLQVALMGLLYWLLTIAGTLACCIGVFFTIPIATLMAGVGYDRLIRSKGTGITP
jgi:hypothetical protein